MEGPVGGAPARDDEGLMGRVGLAPVQAGLQVGAEGSPVGLVTEVVPTVAELLGIKSEVLSAGLIDPQSMSLFDRI